MYLLPRIAAAFDPPRYHGWGKKRHYFEGWYFKLTDPAGRASLAVIPGISMNDDGTQHAFIQLLDGLAHRTYYHEFPAEEFQPAPDRFDLRIGTNRFTTDLIQLDLPEVSGALHFSGVQPWPARPFAPGVMGWYGLVPGLECYHGLVSFHHVLEGSLQCFGRATDFSGGIGYTEKDWGRSFPLAWVWTQSNHLDHPAPASLMASVARIPWRGRSFTGFLCTFLFAGELHTFATWTGAKINLHITTETVTLTFTHRRKRLRIQGRPGPGGSLASPIKGGMTGKISESLEAELQLEFTVRGTVVYQGPARRAGLEVTENARAVLVG